MFHTVLRVCSSGEGWAVWERGSFGAGVASCLEASPTYPSAHFQGFRETAGVLAQSGRLEALPVTEDAIVADLRPVREKTKTEGPARTI